MLTVIAGGREYRSREVREKQVVVRVQRRVRMGMKDELGPPYILSSSSDHMTIYLYLFGSLYCLFRSLRVYPVLRDCAAVFQNILALG